LNKDFFLLANNILFLYYFLLRHIERFNLIESLILKDVDHKFINIQIKFF